MASGLLPRLLRMGILAEKTSRLLGGGQCFVRCALVVVATLAPAGVGHAGEASQVDSGDTAWMLTSSALVLMMTAPGLALFYGGRPLAEHRALIGAGVMAYGLTSRA